MSIAAKRVPGEAGLWVMVLGDMFVFGLFFVTFAVYRLEQGAAFAAAQAHLNQHIGLLNTMLLLTSSFAVAAGLEFARCRRTSAARRAIGLGIVMGLGFVAMKAVEYREKIAAGIGPSTNDFYMFYYCFTGIHLLHVIAGLGALAFMRSRAGAKQTPGNAAALECCAVFWHLVDVLWVVLFAILYLHR